MLSAESNNCAYQYFLLSSCCSFLSVNPLSFCTREKDGETVVFICLKCIVLELVGFKNGGEKFLRLLKMSAVTFVFNYCYLNVGVPAGQMMKVFVPGT